MVQAARLSAFSHQWASDKPLAPGPRSPRSHPGAGPVAGLGSVTQIAGGFQFGLAIGRAVFIPLPGTCEEEAK